jgi:hypothetical protein
MRSIRNDPLQAHLDPMFPMLMRLLPLRHFRGWRYVPPCRPTRAFVRHRASPGSSAIASFIIRDAR